MFKKYAFFDVDGVLSAPRFINQNNEFVIGFGDNGWKEYLDTYKEDAYQFCGVFSQLYKYLNDLVNDNTELYVLSAVTFEIEKDAKIKFLNDKYPNIFKDYFFVNHSLDKIDFINNFCKERNINTQNCMLIDDTYDLLLVAHSNNIQAIHISNVLAENISK